MVDQTLFPPPPDNPDRAHVAGSGRDFVIQFAADTATFLRRDGTWAIPPGSGSVVWGSITGTLSAQTDLQNALNLKANSSAISTVGFTGAYSDLTGKPTLGTLAALSYPGGTATFLRADGTWQTPVDVTAQWGNITGTLSAQTDLQNALNLKANLASPTFTGVPLSTTAALDTSTTQIATTAFVMNQAFSGTPLMDGTASSGSSTRWMRGDHVHPSDTSRAPLASPALTGVPTAPTAAVGTSTTQIATTAFVYSVLNGPIFSAYRNATQQTLTDNTYVECVFNAELVDTANCYDTSTGRFTPNVAGTYQFNAVVSLDSSVATGDMANLQVAFYKNGAFYKRGELTLYKPSSEVSIASLDISASIQMNGTTDYVSVWAFADCLTGTPRLNGAAGGHVSWFDGFLVTAGVSGGGGGGMTNPMTTLGDIIVGGAAGAPTRQAIGSNLTVLGVNGSGVLGYNGITTYGAMNNPFTTRGDILAQGVSAPGRIGIGASGTILTSNGTDPSWGTPASVNIPTMASAAAATGRVITSAGADRSQQDSGILLSNIPTMASNAAGAGNVLTSAGASKAVQDSGTALTALATLASPTFTGTPLAPTAATGTSTTQIATTAFVQQEKLIPQNSQSAAYTCVLADANKHLYHPSADTTARIWTIPANASVAYVVGTTLTFVNDSSAGAITIAITSDTLVLAGTGSTGSRTLAANGIATAIKMTSTRWQINGTGLT